MSVRLNMAWLGAATVSPPSNLISYAFNAAPTCAVNSAIQASEIFLCGAKLIKQAFGLAPFAAKSETFTPKSLAAIFSGGVSGR